MHLVHFFSTRFCLVNNELSYSRIAEFESIHIIAPVLTRTPEQDSVIEFWGFFFVFLRKLSVNDQNPIALIHMPNFLVWKSFYKSAFFFLGMHQSIEQYYKPELQKYLSRISSDTLIL
jgi:hypothetical protein